MFFELSWGTTRFVILIGPWAIKIARFRLLWMIKRFIVHLLNREVGAKVSHQMRNPSLATSNIFAGILANLREDTIWQYAPHDFLVPVYWSAASGLVNIQPRGKKVNHEELMDDHPLRDELGYMPSETMGDMYKIENFCHYSGRVCLLDYGSEKLFEYFIAPHQQNVKVRTAR